MHIPFLSRIAPGIVALFLLAGCAAPTYTAYRAGPANIVQLKDSTVIPIDASEIAVDDAKETIRFGDHTIPYARIAQYQYNNELWRIYNNVAAVQKIVDAPINLWQGQTYIVFHQSRYGISTSEIKDSYIQKGSGSMVKMNYPNLRRMIPENGAGHLEMVRLNWNRRGSVFMMAGGAAAMLGGFLTFVDGSISENQTKKNIGYGLMCAGVIAVPVGYFQRKANANRLFKVMDVYNRAHGWDDGSDHAKRAGQKRTRKMPVPKSPHPRRKSQASVKQSGRNRGARRNRLLYIRRSSVPSMRRPAHGAEGKYWRRVECSGHAGILSAADGLAEGAA